MLSTALQVPKCLAAAWFHGRGQFSAVAGSPVVAWTSSYQATRLTDTPAFEVRTKPKQTFILKSFSSHVLKGAPALL